MHPEQPSERVDKQLNIHSKNFDRIIQDLIEIKKNINLEDKIDNNKLSEVKQTIDALKENFKSDLFNLKNSIDSNFTTVTNKFDDIKSREIKLLEDNLKQEFHKDVKLFISSELESQVLSTRLVDDFIKLYSELNKIQVENMKAESKQFSQKIDQKIEKAFENFDVKFKESIKSLETTLTLPEPQK